MLTRNRFLLLVTMIAALAVVAVYGTGTTEPETTEDGVYEFTWAFGPWDVGDGRLPLDEQPTNRYYQYVAEEVGAVPLTTSWEWDGSRGYVQGLRLALVSGEQFEALMPYDPILAQELIDSDIAIPLDDLIEEYAPNVKSAFTESQWDQIRTAQGGQIYYIPQYSHKMSARAGFIRKDWLERVGLDVPTTVDELLEVYRAFKAQDANGNGDPNDEIPVSGREGFRWFDDLFTMHGVSMYEGHPHWRWNEDLGIFESDQVSDEMFNAISFIKQLYDEGLMDATMPAQPNADWTAKINAGRVGHYFHLVYFIDTKSAFAYENADDPTGLDYWTVMPQPPLVPGVGREDYYYPVVGRPYFMITKWAQDPAAIMRWFDWSSSPEGNIYAQVGIEGENYVREDGRIVVTNDVEQYYLFRVGFRRYVPDLFVLDPMGEVKVQILEQILPHLQDLEDMMMPNTVYSGHEDFAPASATLYREAFGKFLTGEWPLTEVRWEAYKADWYARGGQEVTDRATAWYRDFFGN